MSDISASHRRAHYHEAVLLNTRSGAEDTDMDTVEDERLFAMATTERSRSHSVSSNVHKPLVGGKRTYLFALWTLVVICLSLGVYIYISKLLDGSLDVNVYNKQMVVYSMPETYFTRAQGMFADFLAVIGALHYATTHKAAAVRVYFDNDFYIDKQRGPNWWAYFFEPVMHLRTPIEWPQGSPAEISDLVSQGVPRLNDRGKVDNAMSGYKPALAANGLLAPDGFPRMPLEEVHFTKWLSRFGKLGSFSSVMTKSPYKPKGLFARFTYPVHGVDLSVSHNLVQNHIRVKYEIAQRVDYLRREIFGPAYIAPYSPSARPGSPAERLVRSGVKPSATRCPKQNAMECAPLQAFSPNSLRSEYLYPSEFLNLEGGSPDGVFIIGVHYRGLDKIDAYPYRLAPPDLFRVAVSEVLEVYKPKDYLIFVASDTADFIPFAKAHWGEDKVVALDVPRIAIKDVEYQDNGIPIPMHKSDKIPNYVKAESAILDMLLLAGSNYIVKNRSSLSDTSLAMAPNMINYTFILGADDPVYSTDPRMSTHPEFSDSDFDLYFPGKTSPPPKQLRRAGLQVPKNFVPYVPLLTKK